MAYGLQWDIRFNHVKSRIACSGCKSLDCDCINIGGKIHWRDCIKYLHATFVVTIPLLIHRDVFESFVVLLLIFRTS